MKITARYRPYIISVYRFYDAGVGAPDRPGNLLTAVREGLNRHIREKIVTVYGDLR